MRRIISGLCAGVLVATLAPAALAATATPTPNTHASAAPARPLAATPPLGWNDWNAYQCNNNWQDIEQTALYIHTSGLQADGYQYVNNDGCWDDMVGLGTADPSGHTLTTLPAEACGAVDGRLPNGQIFVNTTEFPPSAPCANDGLKIVAAYVHSLGLKFGLYLDASNNWNSEEIPGSYGFDTQDADTFASWGVDYVKADWGASATTVPPANDPLGGPTFGSQPAPLNLSQLQLAQLMYGALGTALQATGRPIVYSIAGAGVPSPQDWGPAIANTVRPAGDSSATFANLLTIIDTDDQYAADQTPGHWIDPDVMEVGNGMSKTEDQTEMSMFAELGFPLLMSTNLVNPAGGGAQQAYDLSIFGNQDVLAVDQDPLGKMGTLVSSVGGLDVFAKPLSDGDVSVALFNTTSTPTTISTTAGAVGLSTRLPLYSVTDLWSKTVTETTGAISAFVPAHGTAMYRVSAANPLFTLFDAPNTTLGMTASTTALATSGQSTVTVDLTNNGATPIDSVNLSVQAPAGWSATQVTPQQGKGRLTAVLPILTAGKSEQAVFTVDAPATAPPLSSADVSASAAYNSIVGKQTDQSSLGFSLTSPVAGPYQTANTTGTAAQFGQSGTSFAIDTAGTGIAPAGSRGAASDQYGAIYRPAGADASATVQATVTSQAATGRNAKAGILVRDDATAPANSPEGVALYVTGTGTVGMSWAANGGTAVDTQSAQSAATAYPVQLKLVRNGTSYTGYYSTDGVNWSAVATATLSAAGSSTLQDAGLFATSASAGAPAEADFTGLTVTG